MTKAGECSTAIGAMITVNSDGWMITAAHIATQYIQLNEAALKARELEKEGRLDELSDNDTRQASAWWGDDNHRVHQFFVNETLDLALCRIDNFNPARISNYPRFKSPDEDMDVGATVCRVGFPFHYVESQWDAERASFVLPEGALPAPVFVNEGVVARFRTYSAEQGAELPYPFEIIETSSPGLRGQSGGPIVDTDGYVWGMQTQTAHYPLGFNPRAPDEKGTVEHQFLNAGWGAHSRSIIGIMSVNGVSFNSSSE